MLSVLKLDKLITYFLFFNIFDNLCNVIDPKSEYFILFDKFVEQNILMILVLNYMYAHNYKEIIQFCIVTYISIRLWIYFIKFLFFIGETIMMIL